MKNIFREFYFFKSVFVTLKIPLYLKIFSLRSDWRTRRCSGWLRYEWIILLENRICVTFVMTGSRNSRRKIISIIMSVKVNTIHFYTHEIIIIIMHSTKTIIFIDIINKLLWNIRKQDFEYSNEDCEIYNQNLTAQIWETNSTF